MPVPRQRPRWGDTGIRTGSTKPLEGGEKSSKSRRPRHSTVDYIDTGIHAWRDAGVFIHHTKQTYAPVDDSR